MQITHLTNFLMVATVTENEKQYIWPTRKTDNCTTLVPSSFIWLASLHESGLGVWIYKPWKNNTPFQTFFSLWVFVTARNIIQSLLARRYPWPKTSKQYITTFDLQNNINMHRNVKCMQYIHSYTSFTITPHKLETNFIQHESIM